MAEETTNLISKLKADKEKVNQQCREEMKKVETIVPDHLQHLFNDVEEKLNGLHESEKALFQALQEQEAVYQAAQAELDQDIEKFKQNEEKLEHLFFAGVVQGRFDGRRMKLVKGQQEALWKRIYDQKVRIGAMGLEKMRCFYKSVKLCTEENDAEGMEKVGEMEKDLKEVEIELDFLKLNGP